MDVHACLANTPPHLLIRSISSLSQSSIRPPAHVDDTPQQEKNVGSIPALKKGILLQARDKLFSRWKERFFVLTRDYLACFRRGTTKYSEMGSFIFKVNLATVEYVGWEDRRGGPVLSICLPREGKMLLRAKAGLDQWYRELREATAASRNRRNALRRGSSTTHLNSLSNNLQISPHLKSGGVVPFNLSDSTPEIVQLCESVNHDSSLGNARNISRANRFSLVSNIEMGSCEGYLASPPSSVNSSHKFSSTNTSGSGGSSSQASSPSLKNLSARSQASSPVRSSVIQNNARTRLSLYESSHEAISSTAKTRHSVCVEPRGLNSDLSFIRQGPSMGISAKYAVNNHSKDAYTKEASFSHCLQPRNPLLELLESELGNFSSTKKDSMSSSSKLASPAKSEPGTALLASRSMLIPMEDSADAISNLPAAPRPRTLSTSLTPEKSAISKAKTNLAIFRHSSIFN